MTRLILMHQARHKLLRQDDIFHINGISKEWSNLLVAESCYAATYSGDKKREFGVLFGKADELIHIGLDSINSALHGRNGVCLTMKTNAFAPYGTKPLVSQSCSTATMCACQIASKHEYLAFFQFQNPFGCISSVVHNSHILFNTHNPGSARLTL